MKCERRKRTDAGMVADDVAGYITIRVHLGERC